MSVLSRREVLTGAAIMAVVSSAPSLAAAPKAGKQAPGFYRYLVGDLELTTVNDGVSRMPITDSFVLNASKDRVNAALDALFMERDFYAGPYNPLLINTGKKLVLIDTGTGPAGLAASKGLNGLLLQNLAAAGVDRNDIDAVVLTHYHGDHINGLLGPDGAPAFPNAEVLAPALEHKFWTDEGELSRTKNPRVVAGFENVRKVLTPDIRKRLRTYEWDKEVLPGITAVATPGHTPGHTSLIAASGKDTIYIQGDVTHAPFLFARHPEWHFFLDIDPVAAEATRRKVYDMLAADRMRVQGFHYPFPAQGHVEKRGNGYVEHIVGWNPRL